MKKRRSGIHAATAHPKPIESLGCLPSREKAIGTVFRRTNEKQGRGIKGFSEKIRLYMEEPE